MTNLHIVAVANTEEGILKVEMDGKSLEMETTELAVWVTNGLVVTYEESEEVTEMLKHTTIKYITVDTEADGSDSHDVYEHKAILDSGEIKMDIEGEFIKSYKNEATAIKFAKSFGVAVRIN